MTTTHHVVEGLIHTFILITAVQECIVTAETQPKPNHGTTALTTHPELNQKCTRLISKPQLNV